MYKIMRRVAKNVAFLAECSFFYLSLNGQKVTDYYIISPFDENLKLVKSYTPSTYGFIDVTQEMVENMSYDTVVSLILESENGS